MKSRKLYVVLAAMLIAVMILSACGATATTAPEPTMEPTAEPTALPPTAEPAAEVPDAGGLTANPWQWTSFTNPMEQFDVEMPGSYLVTFGQDTSAALGAGGTVNIVADCNNASGSYTDDAGSLTIEVGGMTRAMCPDGSRSDEFVTYLGAAARYFFEDGMLYIDLFADGGTMAFAPANPELMAGDGEGAMAGSLPAEMVAQLDAYLQSQVWTEGGEPAGAAPGLVLLVDTPQGRYLSAAGVSSIEDGTPMQVDDILEIGSNTKSMTVVLLMQLQEEGVLSMDDMLSDWLPDLAARIPNGEQVTLRQMANMATGFWDYGDELMGIGTSDPDKLVLSYEPEEVVEYAIENGTPDFAPGEGFKYSNTNYILLGMIAEKATGQSLADLLQQRVFDPLGMETAVFIEGVPQVGEITSQGYWWNEDGSRVTTTDWNGSQGWAAGAAAMTAEDLLVYGKALGQGELFENPDSLAQMLPFNDAARLALGGPYGLGLIEMADGYFGHGGQTLGFQSIWYTNPDEGITVVGLTNSATYPAWNLVNVLNIVDGEGAKPLSPVTMMPVGDDAQGILGDAVASWWEWVQMADASGVTDSAPGTFLLLFKDGSAKVKSEACGEAAGTFAVDPSWQISFDLDASGITCDSGEPAAQLLGLLDSADTWRFENGGLAIALDDGATLLFKVAAAK